MAFFGDDVSKLCEALKKRAKYVEITGMGKFENILNDAYKMEPKLTGCVVGWKGQKSSSGLLSLSKTYRLDLEYADKLVADFDQVILDDGSWKPSDTLAAMSELPPVLQIVTTDVNDLQRRINEDSDFIRESVFGLSDFYYEWNQESINGYHVMWVTFKYIVEPDKYVMYRTLAARELERIDRRSLGVGNIPKIIKAFLAFSYIQQNCQYDQASADLITAKLTDKMDRRWVSVPYGPLVKKMGVCEGIATAYKMFMDYYGIKSRIVFGHFDGEEANSHCWNMICLNDKYYHVDATYGISGEGIYIGCFMKDDTAMSETHNWDMSKYPQCTSRNPDYDYIESYIDDHANELSQMGVEDKYMYPDDVRE